MVVPPIVSDSIFTNLHFSSARLTRALSRLEADIRFSILSVLVVIVLVALTLGWYVDRQRLTKQLQSITAGRDSAVDNAIGVTSRTTQARCHILAERHAQKFPGKLREVIQSDLLYDITEVWRDRTDINEDEANQAYNLAYDALLLLNIDSPDKFMATCKKRFDDPEMWPEFHDQNHEDYASIEEFVRESLDPKYATKWGW